jgi:hypothetical protein
MRLYFCSKKLGGLRAGLKKQEAAMLSGSLPKNNSQSTYIAYIAFFAALDW